MLAKLRALLRITAVRLSLIYTLVFGLAAVGIIAYMTGATVNVLRQQYEESIDQEVDALSRLYQRGGLNLVFRVLERRANAPGANLYAVANPQGQIIAGNVPAIERGVMAKTGWKNKPFAYERYDQQNEGDEVQTSKAIARVIELPSGVRILVGRDIREYEQVGEIVGDAFKIAIGIMLGLGLLTWLFVGRRALARIDQVTQSSRRILSGDRTERLPVTGSKDEFDRLSQNLNLMLDRINTLDEGLKQISDNIAHDLKTPITRLRNKAYEALQKDRNVDEQREAIGEIIVDCDQIVKTFDALMMISRVGSGSAVGKLETVELNGIVSDVHELYEAVADEEGINLDLAIHAKQTITLQGNRELLSQAIANLLDNAIKYGRGSDESSGILLELDGQKDVARITVSDHGPGIGVDDRERVKDRFVRLDKSRNKPGNGLGLSLVNAIAEFHGGSLVLEDNNPGLRAIMVLPLGSKRSG